MLFGVSVECLGVCAVKLSEELALRVASHCMISSVAICSEKPSPSQRHNGNSVRTPSELEIPMGSRCNGILAAAKDLFTKSLIAAWQGWCPKLFQQPADKLNRS